MERKKKIVKKTLLFSLTKSTTHMLWQRRTDMRRKISSICTNNKEVERYHDVTDYQG